MPRLIFAFLLLVASSAFADDQPMTPEQMSSYIGILFKDRVDKQLEIDRLKIQIEDLKRASDARAAEVDAYWKRWTGIK